MPWKFTRVVQKRYSMKETDSQTTIKKMADVGTQTDDVKSADVSTQADLLQPSANETGVHTNIPLIQKSFW